MPPAHLTVRAITPAEHLSWLRGRRSASFLQTPAWGAVKSEWRHESLGWFRDAELVGAGLVLYRQLPRVKRYLAYLPEGPVLDWEADDLAVWLRPMADYLKGQGAFGVRMGPPVVTRRWDAATVKAGIADPAVRRLGDLVPTERSHAGARVVAQLRELGWRPQAVEGGFAAGQPQYVFQVPLAGRTEDEVLAGMNQLWRRNIKKATKEGVEVASYDGPAIEPELKSFHDLYVHTAERDHFTPRPLSYFRTMVEALGAEEPDRIRLYAARHEGTLVAATIAIRVGGHAWYSYGASSTEKREVRGSNAVQWAMIRDAIAAGADVYDLRGITDTLSEDDPHLGLIQFKVGTGGEAVEYAGEWDLPLNKPLYKAFDVYMRRR
ncbi:peptidoglycan bridge formation glycyltransferase FemA/FemB family protein [Nocardioides sp. MAH-18]|uniref:Peptidoglycan bridge formation glycyltransferase FemA/FemB family protein n=1 Tax=Nocardioides agri TaxID=2682843 RepID=A0A6L6XTD4_9ACTN|nr:peptidoglycan bridge formation glycyltransferase FemA/FemB family protein [Nocardioides sp. CGMCC 1.13656]MBA2955043.1 peptidoglycan bridge formation glycyltransferase FemA/FemB family protein [Nocardioides sp. CGMCC 1.13656]MVQ49897.1 peptidoglycan bridge formation glycyltransferase FemA/FemB family protein [Nocardioides sp. MAH-18]